MTRLYRKGESKWDALKGMEIGQEIFLANMTQRGISSGIHRANKIHKARYTITQLQTGVLITRLPVPEIPRDYRKKVAE